MIITRAAASDAGPIMSLIRQAIGVMQKNGIDQWDENYPNKEIIAEDITAKYLYKIAIDGKLAGIIVLNEWQSPEYAKLHWQDNEGRPLVVHRLCLHPDFQGKGLAKQLMQFAEAHAIKNKYSSIRLDTYSKNFIALNLYDSLKYRRVGDVSFREGKTFHCFEKVIKTR